MARRSGKTISSLQISATVPAGSSARISVTTAAGSSSAGVCAIITASSSAPVSATISATVAKGRNNGKAIRHSEAVEHTQCRGRRVDAVMGAGGSTTTQTQTQSRQPSAPGFTRQGPYYETNITDAAEYTYLEASDVRRQVQEAPSRLRSEGGYPKVYRNNPPLPLRSVGPHIEYPIVPSPFPGEAGANYRHGKSPGPVRAIFHEDDRSRFDVGFHDDTKAPLGSQKGRKTPNSPFSLATYHPGPLDFSKLKKRF